MEFLLLLGAPGSGKGTLSRHLQERDGFLPVSTGELIRQRMSDPHSDFGRKARPYMDRGDYIPDELAMSLFFSHMDEFRNEARLALDGFPRTVPQAEVFRAWCAAAGHRLLGCAFLELEVDIAVARMRDRRVCAHCRCPYHLTERPPAFPGVCDRCGGQLIPREDDDPERLERRMRRHQEQIRPLYDWFAERETVLTLDGRKDPVELRGELMRLTQPEPEKIRGQNSD